MEDWKDYLATIYFDPRHPGSFAGPEKLFKVVRSEGKFGIGRHRIRRWLQDQESYSLSKGVRRRFPRPRVIVRGLDSMWDVDLMDMTSLAKRNDGYRFVLVCLDVFSRYLWCVPLRTKTGKEVAEALRSVLSEGRKPENIRTDKGTEFKNKDVSQYLKSVEVHHFVTQNEPHANYAERVIKTVKGKLFRYLMKKRTERYVDVLTDIVLSYNNTEHQSLGRTPFSIDTESEAESRLEQYLIRNKREKKTEKKKSKGRQRYKYKIGQTVRLSYLRHVFDREYSQKWTGELFKIARRFRRDDIPMYVLEDWIGDDVEGTFYQSELQAINVNRDAEYSVEKILSRRSRNKRKEVLVRWLHWPKKYDSWIPASDVQNYGL